jgi:hypothetical protein
MRWKNNLRVNDMISRLLQKRRNVPRIYWVFAVTVIVLLVSTHRHVESWNDASRMALAASIVENSTLCIDKSVFAVTGDKVFIKGHFYSDKPPIMSFLAAVIYYPLNKLGFTLTFQDNFAYYIITLLINGAGLLLCVVAFYLLLKQYPIQESHRVLLTSALAVGSLLLPWSVVFNNNCFSACYIFIGFFLIQKAVNSPAKKSLLILAGICQSLAVSADHVTGLLGLSCFLVIISTKEIRGYFLFYLLPVLLLISATLFYYYSLSGSVLPFEVNKQLWVYPGSSWNAQTLSGLHSNTPFIIVKTAVKYSIGPNGILVYSPFLVIGLYYAFVLIKRKQAGSKTSFLLFAGIFLTAAYYCLFAEGAGGCSYSIRWFLPFVPIIYYHVWPFFREFNKFKKMVFVILFCYSLIVSVGGIINPWVCYPKNGSAFMENVKTAFGHLPKRPGN